MIRRIINGRERGFTLLELAIAVGLGSIIAGAATTAIFQVIEGSARTNNHMTAVRQVQSAGYWVSHDTQMAQDIITGNSTSDGFPFTLSWTAWDTTDYEVVYSLEDMSGGLKNLQRSYSVNGTVQETTHLGGYIDPDETYCQLTAGAFSLPDVNDEFTITEATGGDTGTIVVTTGSISVATGGTATYNSGTGIWATPGAGDTIAVTAVSANTTGDWTYTAETAAAAITTDANSNASITTQSVLVFKVTVVVGSGSQEQSDTRIYRVSPRPS